MRNIALITGASSEMGKAFAHYHAQLGRELVLTARSEIELLELSTVLQNLYGVKAEIVTEDLSLADGPAALFLEIQKMGIKIDILINNAGFAGYGRHIDRDLMVERKMVDLNIQSLMSLTHMFGRDMVRRGGGKILNVGSVAGFVPGPNFAAYHATKAFVHSFGQAIDHELRPLGVTCTTLAPGFVKNDFSKHPSLRGTKLTLGGGAQAESVARFGYRAMMNGELMAIPGRKSRILYNWIVPLVSRRKLLEKVEGKQMKWYAHG